MLTRQRVLLDLLRRAHRPVGKLEFMKWAFLLKQETSTQGGKTFYQFLPYHYGPYSFTLDRELRGLSEQGYVEETEAAWCFVDSVPNDSPLEADLSYDVSRIISRHSNHSVDQVVDLVYNRFPEFTVNSRRQKLAQRRHAEPAIYTAGYEGLQVDGLLDLLIRNGIDQLIDVRNNPVARRFGFHKSTLSRLCGLVGIRYWHLPHLGIPSAERKGLSSPAQYRSLFENYYKSSVLDQQNNLLEELTQSLSEMAGTLLCTESDYRYCHRSYLASNIADRSDLEIIHLPCSRIL